MSGLSPLCPKKKEKQDQHVVLLDVPPLARTQHSIRKTAMWLHPMSTTLKEPKWHTNSARTRLLLEVPLAPRPLSPPRNHHTTLKQALPNVECEGPDTSFIVARAITSIVESHGGCFYVRFHVTHLVKLPLYSPHGKGGLWGIVPCATQLPV
jgi:hypothetical protein